MINPAVQLPSTNNVAAGWQGNVNDEALRQLCARLCREWLIWSAKHITGPRGAALNATSLVRRLLDRISHPNAYQR